MRVLSVLSLAAAASAQAPSWLGIRPSASTPGEVELIDLADAGTVNRVIGVLALGRGEVPWADAVRCLPGPPAFCLFATTATGPGPAAGNESYIYRIDAQTAALVWKAACPGTCAHMHVDYSSTRAYTFSYEGPRGVRAEVVEIPAAGGAPVQVADISAAVAGGLVQAGQTTHCSATNHMYIGVSHGGAGKDQVLAVNLATGLVDATTTLTVPLFAALWATCDGSGVIGGISFDAGAGVADFGTVDAAGAYTKKDSVAIKTGFVPSGLLTATSPAAYTDSFVAAFYPPGSLTNASHTAGLLWDVDPYGGGTADDTYPIDFMLVGAAWDRGGR